MCLGLAYKRIGRVVKEGQSTRLPRLHHVTVLVPPHLVGPCLDFYRSVLGLSSVHSSVQKAVWFEQGIHLYYGVPNYDEPVAAGPQHFALVMGDEYDEVVATCKKLGMHISNGTSYWGSPRCYVRDPAHNRIELMERAP